MVLQSLAGLPAFLAYFCVSRLPSSSILYIYTRITAHDEFELHRREHAGRGDLARPEPARLRAAGRERHRARRQHRRLHRSGASSRSFVQVIVYYLVRIPVPDLSQRIAAGELAPAIWLGLASVTAGLLSAASMTW